MKLFKKRINLKYKFEKLVQDLNSNFQALGDDYDEMADNYRALRSEFNELREELATNGVVRDLRKSEKELKELQGNYLRLVDYINLRFADLDKNGVATAINKLNAEVFADLKGENLSPAVEAFYRESGADLGEQATLAGKVDAIVQHLGVEISVKPKEVKVEEAKVVVKKAKKGKK